MEVGGGGGGGGGGGKDMKIYKAGSEWVGVHR